MTSLRETMFRPQDFCQGETPWPARLRLFRNRGGDNGGRSAASQNQDSTDCSQCPMNEVTFIQSQYPEALWLSRSVSKLCLSIGLSSRDAERLNNLMAERIKVRRGSALYRIGDPLCSIYAVRVGAFKTGIMSVNGHNQILGFQMSGDMLGLEVISTGYYGCDAVALEDSEVSSINYFQLETLAQDLPAVQHNLSKLLSCEIVRDRHMMFLMGNLNSKERLAGFLLNLSQQLSVLGNSSTNFVLKMSREDIGSYIGLRLETICRCIAHFRNHGLAEITGRDVKILNAEGLRYLISGLHRNVRD